jgi:hypothetical protein
MGPVSWTYPAELVRRFLQLSIPGDLSLALVFLEDSWKGRLSSNSMSQPTPCYIKLL